MEFWLLFAELLGVVAVTMVAVAWVLERREHRRAAREQKSRERALADRLHRAERQPRDHPFERSNARRGNGSL